jgi:hypothetical protein
MPRIVACRTGAAQQEAGYVAVSITPRASGVMICDRTEVPAWPENSLA